MGYFLKNMKMFLFGSPERSSRTWYTQQHTEKQAEIFLKLLQRKAFRAYF